MKMCFFPQKKIGMNKQTGQGIQLLWIYILMEMYIEVIKEKVFPLSIFLNIVIHPSPAPFLN